MNESKHQMIKDHHQMLSMMQYMETAEKGLNVYSAYHHNSIQFNSNFI